MPSLNHTHTYIRRRVVHPPKNFKTDFLIGGERTFMCADPDCSHYAARSLVLGKRSRCNKCHNEFILDAYSLGMVIPFCINCRSDKKAREHQRVKEIATNVLEELFPEDGEKQLSNQEIERDSIV